MRFDIITIFPEMFAALDTGVIGRAKNLKKILQINTWDLRDFTLNKHGKVDAIPYGGGAGMVMTPEPFFRAVTKLKTLAKKKKTRVIYFTPGGRRFDHAMAVDFAKKADRYILLCGRYEGVDQRVIDELVDDEISIGDFVLSGGELPAMTFIDAVSRQIPGVLGEPDSLLEESFSDGLDGDCEYPCYTRPAIFRGMKVPDVLQSGDHGKIDAWRKSKIKTKK